MGQRIGKNRIKQRVRAAFQPTDGQSITLTAKEDGYVDGIMHTYSGLRVNKKGKAIAATATKEKFVEALTLLGIFDPLPKEDDEEETEE